MRSLFRFAAPWVAALAVLSLERPACARAPRLAAVIVRPKRNDPVSREAELFGRLLLPGRPVVLVREDQPDSLWYVQDAGQPMDDKTLSKAPPVARSLPWSASATGALRREVDSASSCCCQSRLGSSASYKWAITCGVCPTTYQSPEKWR